MTPTANDLLDYVKGGAGQPTEQQALTALTLAEAAVSAYVRGRGKTSGGDWKPGLGEVILSAAARIVANPSGIQYRDQAGVFSTSRQSSFEGFTLAELVVLNRYRKSAV